MIVTFKKQSVRVTDLAEASAVYCAARDKSGAGQRIFPRGEIKAETGETVAYISYNGRVWRDDPCARDWKPGATALYNPYAEASA